METPKVVRIQYDVTLLIPEWMFGFGTGPGYLGMQCDYTCTDFRAHVLMETHQVRMNKYARMMTSWGNLLDWLIRAFLRNDFGLACNIVFGKRSVCTWSSERRKWGLSS